jgi:hypothetical protein
MAPDERLGLARLAYVQAIVGARAHSSSSTWRRLLAAAKNVRAAIREQERQRSGRPAVAPGALRASGSGEPGPSPAGGTVGVLASSPYVPDLVRACELRAALEQARTLLERSRRLVDESRALLARARRAAPVLLPIIGS